MTAQEMHIEVDLELQKINSQINKNLLPQEKDWFLNNEVIKFLKQRTNSLSNVKGLGFENTSKRVADIKDLIKAQNLPIETNSQGKKYVTLPSDYFDYIRFDAYSYKDCSTVKVKPTSTTKYECKIDLNISNNTVTEYKIELTTSTGVIELFNITSLPSNYLNAVEFNKQKFLLLKALKIKLEAKLKEVLSPNVSLYWERKGYDFNNYTVILVSDVEYINVKVSINTNVNTFIKSDVKYSIIEVKNTPLKARTRVINEEFLTDVENSHLSRSIAQSPVTSVKGGVLELSNMLGAIYGSVDITYICKPNIIDLSLDSNLNVADSVAKEITGNTIRFLKAILNDTNYQAYAQENILIE